jgi:ribosomal protein S18 acetylase RimI-like enzyme
MELRAEHEPDPVDLLFIEQRVRRELIAASGVGDEVELAVFAVDNGVLCGGCYGATWGGTCDLEGLWVDPSLRGRGLGSQLLAAAETEAAARGCRQVVLFTHQNQAPGFYERRGYRVVGRVDDYPTGTPALWFRKGLPETAAAFVNLERRTEAPAWS